MQRGYDQRGDDQRECLLRSDHDEIKKKREEGAVLSYHAVTYTLKVKGKKKEIVRGLSGVMKPGMNAILGPTGSGKTTLLDVLAGRKEVGVLDGEILLDGFPLPPDFKCMSGYVVQDDVVMGTLTIRENLHFSAALRLPGTTSRRDRAKRVDAVLVDLGLTHVAESRIGSELTRGVSGGERKRTNIGMELITSPSVLFMDEPTTGLDAFTAASVMQLLHDLSKRGKTIIFSIHQPRYAIVKLFDSVTLLGNGQTIYHGPSANVLTYFEQLGYVCEQHENPADFFLDTIQNDAVAEEASESLSLAVKYQLSEYARQTQEKLNNIQDPGMLASEGSERMSAPQNSGYPTSRLFQFYMISKRTFLNIIRSPVTSIMQVMINVVFGLLVGGIYFQIGSDENGIQNRVGAIFFIVMNMIFANITAVDRFIHDRATFMHESISGYYSVSAYFLAKTVCDLIPMRVIPVIIFSAISYFMIGFQQSVEKFFFFMLTLILTSVSGSAVAFLYSSLFNVQVLATLFLALTFVFMMVFGGLLVNLATVSKAFHWLKYLSIFRYALEALEINELEGMLFCNSHDKINGICPNPRYNHNTSVSTGDGYLRRQSFYPPDQKWYSLIALGCMLVGILVLAYLRLRFMRKTR